MLSPDVTPLQFGDRFPLGTGRMTIYAAVSPRCVACEPIYAELKSFAAACGPQGVGFEFIWVGRENEAHDKIRQQELQQSAHQFLTVREAHRLLRIRFIPTLYLVNPAGTVQFVSEGTDLMGNSLADIRLKLDLLLDGEGGLHVDGH